MADSMADNLLLIFREFSRKHLFYFWMYAVKIGVRKRSLYIEADK